MVTVNVAASFSDPDGDMLTYAVLLSDSGVAAASVSGSAVTLEPVARGSTTATVTARDPGGLTASLGFTVTVTGSPDLVASMSPDNVAVAPGGSFDYVVAVRNHGDSASVATQTRTFVSVDSVVTTSDEMVGVASDVPALEPGGSVSTAASMTVSTSISPGTVVYVGACVNLVEGESDTSNNCSEALKVTVTVTASPDLVASMSPDNVAVAPGGSFDYVVAVRNHGDSASVATQTRTFVSVDSVVTTSDEMVGVASDVPALEPGGSVSTAASMTVSTSISPGTVVYVGACVDLVEGESDTSNNCSEALKVTVTDWPDLVATVSRDSVSVQAGGDFGYSLEIRNRGGAAAPATRVRTFVSEDSVITRSDRIVGDASRVPPLGPGEFVRGWASMTVSASASLGTVVYIGECVDPVEGESNTANNCSTAIKITIVATGGSRAPESAYTLHPGSGSGVPETTSGAVVMPARKIELSADVLERSGADRQGETKNHD